MPTKKTYGIFTDVASIIVGDPCRIFPEDKWHEIVEEKFKPEYDDRMRFMEETLKGKKDFAPSYDYQAPFVLPNYGIICPTIDNFDAWTAVDVYRNKDGWPTRMVVHLTPLSKNPGD